MRIRLFPTQEQEIKMIKTIGATRWAYNYALKRRMDYYETYKKDLSLYAIDKEIVALKKTEDYSWLNEISSQTLGQTVKINLAKAYKNFFNIQKNSTEKFSLIKTQKAIRSGKSLTLYDMKGHPKFKTKKNSKQSFYVRHNAIYFENGKVNLQKIGKVKYSTNLDIPILSQYIDPCCKFDGKYWYLSFAIRIDENQVELNKDLRIGIDLGIKDLAILNNRDEPFRNINKSTVIKKLERKKKRLSRQCSRKYTMNNPTGTFKKTKNIQKLEQKLKLIERKMINIRNNYLHQITNEIVKMKPITITIEDLNVRGMMKNRHISKMVQDQKFYDFRHKITYKSENFGIKLIVADRWFPSSKMCSSCGNIKKDLKLSNRVYKCSNCGLALDRDKNASINLANYQVS